MTGSHSNTDGIFSPGDLRRFGPNFMNRKVRTGEAGCGPSLLHVGPQLQPGGLCIPGFATANSPATALVTILINVF